MGAGLQSATSPAERKGCCSATICDANDLASLVENISFLLQLMREATIPRDAKLLDFL